MSRRERGDIYSGCDIVGKVRKESAILAAIIILGVFLRAYNIGLPSDADDGLYAYDAYEIYRGNTPYSDFFMSGPPLNIYLTCLSYLVFGVGIASSKLPTVFFSSITLPLIYIVGKRFYSERAALAATLIFSLDASIINFTSHNYLTAEACFFSLLASYLYLRGLDGGRHLLFFAGASAALATAGKYPGAIVLVSMVLYNILYKKNLKVAAVSIAGYLAVLLPILLPFLSTDYINQTVIYYLTLPGFTASSKPYAIVLSIIHAYTMPVFWFVVGLTNLALMRTWKEHDRFYALNLLVALLFLLQTNHTRFFMFGVYFSVSIYAMILLGCRALDYFDKSMTFMFCVLLCLALVSDARIMTCERPKTARLLEDLNAVSDYIRGNTGEEQRIIAGGYSLLYVSVLSERLTVPKSNDMATYRLNLDLDEKALKDMRGEAAYVIRYNPGRNDASAASQKIEDELLEAFNLKKDPADSRVVDKTWEGMKEAFESGNIVVYSETGA